MPSDDQPHHYQWTPQQTPDWFHHAACKGKLHLFYPGETDLWDPKPAVAICGTCPVQRACLDYGLYEKHGIWGGATERQRRQIRRSRRRHAA